MHFRLLLTLFLLVGVNSFAQSPDDILPQAGANIKYLEHLVKIGVDSVRIAHQLKPLRNDLILYKAAVLHTAYMDSVNKLTHNEQGIPNRYAPSDRVDYCGGTGFSSVGENCLYTYALVPLKDKNSKLGNAAHINSTYGQLANDMVNSWVNSPGHYQNIITPEYEFTGVAVTYNLKTGKYYATQVFGTRYGYKPYSPSDDSAFQYNTYIPPPVVTSFDQVSHEPHNKKHAWGLKAPKDTLNTCEFCLDGVFSPGRGTTLFVKNGKIIFRTRDTESMEFLLNNRRDGLAAEVVQYKPVDCGNPQFYEKASRRNGQCLFNGKVQKPLYKRKLKRGFKKKTRYDFKERFQIASSRDDSLSFANKIKVWHNAFTYPFDAEYYEIVLGTVPKSMLGYLEVNLVIIQKKKVCRIIHFTSYCGEQWKVSATSEHPISYCTDTLRLKTVKAKRSFTVPFEQNKYEFSPKDIRPFLDSLSTSSFIIHSAIIEAYASVEGSETINKQLQLRRSQSIIQAMQANQRDTFPFTISTAENWALFEKQIQRTPALAIFKGKSHEEVKQMLLDTSIARTAETWLAKQRYARITLNISIQPQPQPACEWLNDSYKKWTDSTLKSVFKHLYLDSLERLQGYEFDLIRQNKADTQCFRKRKFPLGEDFYTLRWRHARIIHQLDVNKDSLRANQKLYAAVSVIAFSDTLKQKYWEPVFCAAELYTRYGFNNNPLSNDDPQIFLNLLNWLNENAPDSMRKTINNIILSWHYNAVPYYDSLGKKYLDKKDISLYAIYENWNSEQITDSIAIKLAKFLIEYNAVSLAHKTLYPIVRKPQPNHEALILYIKLRYKHYENVDSAYYNNYLALLRQAKTILTHDEWCGMFVGPCNISFQLFDHEGARELYCEECSEYPNYGKIRSKWKNND
ncbi:MAG: CAP domain-containing protein [Bacteroidota bacterium]|jgi:hypothetical protein